jgi:hypothetical protein
MVPAIHVFFVEIPKTWMPDMKPGMLIIKSNTA